MVAFRPFTALLAAASLLPMALAQQGREPAKPEPFTPEVKKAVLERVSEIVSKNAFVPGIDFSKWPALLEAQKESIEKAATETDFVASVNRSLRGLGISHIVLATPKAAQARRERATVGIGVSLQVEPEGLRVTNLFPDGPAAKGGIEIGDLIKSVDGKKADSIAPISGDEGTSLELQVVKGNGDESTITLTRRKFSTVRPETLNWVNPETALLKVYTFDNSYNRKNIETLMDEAAKAKQVIIDLRGNGGGAVANFMHLLAEFLPQNTPVGTFVSRRMIERYQEETKGDPNDLRLVARWSDSKVRPAQSKRKPFAGKVAVLVNGGSGSASEIVAAALQEKLQSPIIGSKSAGAVLVSVMARLPGGFQLQYPVSDYVTMEGIRLEGTGVRPDVEAQAFRFGQNDEAISKAVALLDRARLRDERFGNATAGDSN